MAGSGRHEVREVLLDGGAVRGRGTRIVPTVYFFAPDSGMAAQPLVGAGFQNFYGSFPEQRLQEARAVPERAR